jgi:hypothetical protein
VQAVYSQHAGAERCGAAGFRRRGGRPVAFLARGSHAAYFARGLRDRTWPDPNDEADGLGRAVRPRVVRIGGEGPPWLGWPGPWGRSRASWIPGEQGSPPGPAFQPDDRWSDPAGWAARARPCMARRCNERGECDQPETLMAAAAAGFGLLAAAGMAGRRLRREGGLETREERGGAPPQ